MALKQINKNIIVDTEATLASGDSYYSNFHKSVLTVTNDAHAKGLNLLNSNVFGTLTEKDFNWKIVNMTKEQRAAANFALNYLNLKNAINDPNYPDTAHTKAALIQVENKIKQMANKYIFKLVFEKIIPEDIIRITSK